jgi:hypothetical protein
MNLNQQPENTSDLTKLRRYSRRILNPFRGVMNCLQTPGGEAVTDDGRQWIIYIDDALDIADIPDDELEFLQVADIKYGIWTPEQGLQRCTSRSMTADDYNALNTSAACSPMASNTTILHCPFLWQMTMSSGCWTVTSNLSH